MENKELSIVSNGSHIKGTLEVTHEAHVYGKVEGTILGGPQSQIFIKPHALVKGELKAENITIEGTFDGNLMAENTLTITDNGKVFGTVTAKKINVAHGSLVQAKIKTT